MAEVAEDIKTLGDKLAGLTLKQAVDLGDRAQGVGQVEVDVADIGPLRAREVLGKVAVQRDDDPPRGAGHPYDFVVG